MERKTCYFVSLKYAPGLWKEFSLIGSILREQGFVVKYLISEGYSWMFQSQRDDVIFVSTSRNTKEIISDVTKRFLSIAQRCLRVFQESPPSFVCIYNPHPLNFLVLREARRVLPSAIRTIYLHEPGRPEKKNYGLKGRLFFDVVDVTQRIALYHTTDVILPSKVALEVFDKVYPCYHGRIHHAPLLIPDSPERKGGERRYFSMVGRFNFAKRLDTFIDAINYASQMNDEFAFKIVTSSDIRDSLRRLTPKGREKVTIVRKSRISDDEISECIHESFAVLCLQPMITQSGVVPVAFMNSTPVIVPNIPGFTQVVKHESNGYVLPTQFTVEDIIMAMRSVVSNFYGLSINARATFEQSFSANNWSTYYAWVVKALEKRQ